MKELIKCIVTISLAAVATIVLLRYGGEIGAKKVMQINAPALSQ